MAEVGFGALAIGFRAWLQRRWTGAWGIVGVRRGAGPAAIGAAVSLGATQIAIAAAPILALAGTVRPVAGPGTWSLAVAGFLLAAGTAGTLWAQVAMGPAWRIGLDPDERTELVTGGPFRWIRNPIYSSMVLFDTGIALLVPSLVAIIGVLGLVVAVQLQVRLVEEPYLLRWHRDGYRHWVARTGRFVPRLPLA
jgi:protein-S-isoprenylcysteine O-methyltransferase Ste14